MVSEWQKHTPTHTRVAVTACSSASQQAHCNLETREPNCDHVWTAVEEGNTQGRPRPGSLEIELRAEWGQASVNASSQSN